MACLLCLFLSSCKKDAEIQPVQLKDETSEVSVEVLMEYFSLITHLPQSMIKYDTELQVFTVNGVEQVSRKSLTEYYEIYKKSNEKSFK